MNQAETWRRSERQRAGQRIDRLSRNLEQLRQQKTAHAGEVAESIAATLTPVAETLTSLANEALTAIETNRDEARQAARTARTTCEAANRAATQAREVMDQARRALKPVMLRSKVRVVLITILTILPLIASFAWLAWHNHRKAERWQWAAADLAAFHTNTPMSQEDRQRLEALCRRHGVWLTVPNVP
jgi:leucyl-tRNA synthetase